MKRFGQVMIGMLFTTMWSAGAVQAQTAGPWSAQIDAAATFGHSSSTSFGGEIDRRLNQSWDLTFEAGRMGNITSSSTQDRADIIGTQIAATANPVQSAIFYDLGLRYRLMPEGKWNPYLTAAFGGARIKTETTFSANGADLTADQLAAKLVALGADLDGTIMKPLLVIGAGLSLPLGHRYFLDASYRFGRVFPRTGEIDGDKANNTQRVQIGLGIRF
jgi:opacity protein-like surface antigen